MHSWILAILIVLTFGGHRRAVNHGIIVTTKGVAHATIITPVDATPRELLAGQILQRYIQKISGAVLAIKKDNQPVKGNIIVIGGPERNKKAAQLISEQSFDAEVPGPEGYMMKTFGDRALLLAGSSKNIFEYERGTLYAVYEFLESVLGCSFVAYGKPGEGLGEYIPVKKSISLQELNTAQRSADNTYRTAVLTYYKDIPLDHHLAAIFIDWLSKNKYNRILTMASVYEAYKKNGVLQEAVNRGILFTVGSHESSMLFLPPDGNNYFPEHYYTTHPEYYKLQIKGTRYHARDIWNGQWIFDSRSEEAIDEMARNVKAWFTKNPYVDRVCIWPNDHSDYQCTCDKCSPYSKTANYTYFVNEVAKRVRRDAPNAKIDMLVYSDLWQSPGFALDPAIAIDQANWNTSGLGMRAYGKSDGGTLLGTFFEKNAKSWATNGGPIVYYEYYMGSFGWNQVYFPMADELQSIYADFHANGYANGSGTQIECYNLWNFLLNYYVHGRTAYNTRLTLDDNLKKFTRIFGRGAPFIRSYLTYAESVFEGQTPSDSVDVAPGAWFVNHINKDSVYSLFEKAYDAETEGRLRDNIRLLRMAFRYSDLFVNEGDQAELKYMHDHFDSYDSVTGYGISIRKKGAGNYSPGKWYVMSTQ